MYTSSLQHPSLTHLHHPLDAHLRLSRQLLRQIDLGKFVFEGQVNLFQRVALHIDADIERVAVLVGHGDESLVGAALGHLVEDARLGGYDKLGFGQFVRRLQQRRRGYRLLR